MIPIIKYNNKFLNKFGIIVKINGITFYPYIILQEKYRDIPYYVEKAPILINHETIHIKQQKEMFILFFFIWYTLEWFIKVLKYWSFKNAYRNISFEREGNQNKENLNYLKNRKLYSWIKYL